MQKGFSPLIAVVILAIIGIGAGGAWWYTQQSATSTESDASEEDTASTSASSGNTKGTDKAKTTSKTKVKACDVLTLSKMSSITGLPMSYTPDLTEDRMVYEDEDIWNSVCAFTQTNGTVEENFGGTLMITEGLSAQAKAEMKKEFEASKIELGGVDLPGYGYPAFKVTNVDDVYGSNQYYVLVGNMMVLVHSGVAYGGTDAYGRMAVLSTESNDDVTEEMLRHVLSQLK